MSSIQYIGMRYVPKFDGEWSSTKDYEALVIVTDQFNTSYTSRRAVPAGTPLTDVTYWVPTGIFNAQLSAYRAEVLRIQEEIENLFIDFEALEARVRALEEESEV